MKSLLTGIFTGLILCGLCLAQDTTSAPSNPAAPPSQQSTAPAQSAPSGSAQAAGIPRIAPGSVIPVQLTKSIDAKKAKAGDQVEAKVTEDLKANNGEIIVPKNTEVVGRVTEVQARNKEQKESEVAIAFDHAVTKNGSDVILPMSIQAVIAPSYLAAGSNTGGAEGTGQLPSTGGSGMSTANSGRAAGMGETPAQASAPPTGGDLPSAAQTGIKARQPITGKTQGVLGIENLNLSTANPTQGSVLSSEKNNVKLESGTLILLRVNP
jgi:hypothetical protein